MVGMGFGQAMLNHSKTKYLTIMLLLSFIAPFIHSAEIYKWVDESGTTHFSDEPGKADAEKIDLKSLPPVSIISEPPTPGSQKKPGDELEVHKSYIPGNIVAKGRLLYDGQPLSEYTKAKPVFQVNSVRLQQWFTPLTEYDDKSGYFSIHGLNEGDYSGFVKVDANPLNPEQYPGDYKASFSFSVSSKLSSDIHVYLERILHLTKPQDNGIPLSEWGAACKDTIPLKSPVLLRWESLGADVDYTFTIIRTECEPFAWKETVAIDTVKKLHVLLALPPNKKGEHYTLRLTARKIGKTIGSLMTHGTNGYGWDYRFRVVPSTLGAE